MTSVEILVIGGGLIGAAAAKHLAHAGKAVAVAAPPEPADWSRHSGVFASHYDEARITRKLDADPFWAELARRSVDRYAELEAASGVTFFHPGSCLQLAPDAPTFQAHHQSLQEVARSLHLPLETLQAPELAQRFPWLNPEALRGHLETGTAGWINPRRLIDAQALLAQQAGATWIPEQAEALEPARSGWNVTLAGGSRWHADQVLLTGGAFVNELLPQPLPLQLRTRIVVLAELSEALQDTLRDMPSLLVDYEQHPRLEDTYLLPPVPYPDGKVYVKIGGSNLPLRTAASGTELRRWFQSGGSREDEAPLRQALVDLIPGVAEAPMHHKPCVTVYTQTGKPLVHHVAPGLSVATGGCGKAAKSSEALGELAARLVLGQDDPLLDPCQAP